MQFLERGEWLLDEKLDRRLSRQTRLVLTLCLFFLLGVFLLGSFFLVTLQFFFLFWSPPSFPSLSLSLTVSRSFCYLNLNVSNLNFSPSSTEKPRNENKTRETVRKRSLRNKFRPGLNNKTKRHRELSRREWNKN
jgi:nitrate reductase NapE component